MSNSKPIHCRPNLYAYYFEALKDIAQDYGYNLVIHGSMNRDLDLIAIPWIKEPEPELDLIQAFDKFINGKIFLTKEEYMFDQEMVHRNRYIINIRRVNMEYLNTFAKYKDEQYYLDISVTPLRN